MQRATSTKSFKLRGVLIVLTPYHLVQYCRVAKTYQLPLSNLVVIHSGLVERRSIASKLGLNNHIHRLSDDGISFFDFQKHPITAYKRIKSILKNFECLIQYISNKYIDSPIDMFIGSDKHLFVQMFVNILKRKINKIHAFDEGSSYYVENTFFDHVKNFLFYASSKAIWGYRFRYIGAMGRSKWIDIVYARLPEAISNKHAKVLSIPHAAKSTMPNPAFDTNKLLFISSPFSEYNLLDSKTEREFYYTLIKKYAASYSIDIKPHPAEDHTKFDCLTSSLNNVNILNKKMLAEELNYFQYDKIINFGSSVIIDILSSNYPPKKIYTYLITKKMKLPKFYAKTNIITSPYHNFKFLL